MNLAFGVMFLWLGAACLYLASHGIEASSPWAGFTSILAKAAGND